MVGLNKETFGEFVGIMMITNFCALALGKL
jgi:hypothetical protein